MAILRSDNFDRANNASSIGNPSDGGSTWSADVGTWGITANRAYCPAENGTSHYVVLETSASNVKVKVKLNNPANCGIVARYADSQNFLRARAFTSPDQLQLYRATTAGGVVQIGSTEAVTYLGDDLLELWCESDNTISVYFNNVLKIQVTESSGSSNTKCGMYGFNTTIRLEDFSVEDFGGVGGDSLMGQICY
jgi:hypothetical protein